MCASRGSGARWQPAAPCARPVRTTTYARFSAAARVASVVPLRELRRAVGDRVVVGFIGHEDVLDELQVGRRIERAGHDAEPLVLAAGRAPEQAAAATPAE